MVAAAFTDEQIRILDFRVGPSETQDIGNATMILSEEHTDMIKKIQLSPDGTILFSTGQDGTVKLWDLGMRRCFRTIGPELSAMQRKGSPFHRDTITTMDINFEEKLLFTGGRDGSLFLTYLGMECSEGSQ